MDIDNAKRLIENSNNTNVIFAAKIRMLPMLIAPRGRTSLTLKTSVEKCQLSMLILVKDITEINKAYDERANELKNRGSSVSPMMIAVGEDWENIDEIYICINKNLWLMKNIIVAFDTLFKSFHVLGTGFPKESSVLWGIIQRFIYKMDLPQIDSGATGILVDLKRISNTNRIGDQNLNNIQRTLQDQASKQNTQQQQPEPQQQPGPQQEQPKQQQQPEQQQQPKQQQPEPQQQPGPQQEQPKQQQQPESQQQPKQQQPEPQQQPKQQQQQEKQQQNKSAEIQNMDVSDDNDNITSSNEERKSLEVIDNSSSEEVEKDDIKILNKKKKTFAKDLNNLQSKKRKVEYK
ncbi:hypothetical protein HCN44_010351 [Aphidius gifuensis]|uniref:Uncharacterized protein n=1 Tax=Aphidius gifuensis TaxID=684658 RepID=A0A834XX65_APHGI|nr:hypothetical protein HCN44_010351 [Aphidius gifuensis]